MANETETVSTTESAKADALVGTVIDGKYEVLEKLSHGGIGIVYKGRHSLIDRTVAIKVLHSHLVQDDEWLRRFQHEAQIASRISHPNAILIYDFGVFQGLPYLIMEFANGVTLKEKIKRDGALPLADICTIFEQTCAALHDAHQVGIVHRDLKPDNIMIVRKEDAPIWVEVLDFGIAKIVHGDKPSSMSDLTQTGMFFGTPKYASPEQVLGKTLDGRSDIYSLGVILYEAITGEVPFDAPSIMGTLLKQMNESPPSIRKARPELGVTRILDDLVTKCLAKDAADRYQTVGELANDLRAIRESLVGTGARKVRGGNSPVTFAAIGLVVLLVGAGVFFGVGAIRASNPVPHEEKASQIATTVAEKRNDTAVEATSLAPIVNQPRTGNESWALRGLASLATRTVSGIAGDHVTGEKEIPSPPSFDNEYAEKSLPDVVDPTSSIPSTDDVTVEGAKVETVPQGEEPATVVEPSVTESVVQDTQEVLTDTPTPVITSLQDVETAKATMPSVGAKETSLDGQALFREGEKLYRQRKYAEAAPKLERAVELKPSSITARLALGVNFLKLGRRAEALKQFQAAERIDSGYAPVHLNLACYYALVNDREQAFLALERMVEINPRSRRWIEKEPDLASLRSDPRYRALVNPY